MRLHLRVSMMTGAILIALVVTLLISTLTVMNRYVGVSVKQQTNQISAQLLHSHTDQLLNTIDFARGSLQVPVYSLEIELIGEVVNALKNHENVLEVVVYDAELSVLHDGSPENVGQPLVSALNRLIAYTTHNQQDAPSEFSEAILEDLILLQPTDSSVYLSVGTLQLFQAPVILNGEVIGGLLLLADHQSINHLSKIMLQDTFQALTKSTKVGSVIALVLALVWVAIALTVLVYVMKRMIAPLRQMADAMRKLPDGNASKSLDIQSDDEIGELASAFNDMTKQLSVTMVSRDEYRQLSNLDNLTGLSNRRHCELFAESYLKDNLSAGELAALMVMDLDEFKRINDNNGHTVGDEILKSVAQRLNNCLRRNDIAARIGGDEFIVFATGFNSHNQIIGMVERLLRILTANPHKVNDQELYSYCSIGLSVAPGHGSTFEHLYKCADQAFFFAKSTGKNQYLFYDQELGSKHTRQQQLQQSLVEALANAELYLHYQPQFDLNSGKVIGCEALARWHSPAYGEVLPAEFIPIAESSGLIIQLGRWVLEESCRQLSVWRSHGLTELCIAVNLSSKQFADDGLISFIDTLLARYAIPATCVELEITESILIDDTKRGLWVIEQLKTRGIKLAIDDFGTGYSSLSYLRKLPVHRLKIDRSFLAQDRSEPHDIAIIEAIIRMGQSLDLKVIMEGIETREQAQLLCELGCDQGQGFFFARPMKGDKFLSFCQERSMIEMTPEKVL